jgi:energy-converting hydrogenase Eha subunit A
MLERCGVWIACLCVLGLCGVLLGAFGVQFGYHEFPCPLCILQRMAMLLCALGPAFIIAQSRRGPVTTADIATGYGLSVLAAVGGAIISARQVLLHIVPPDPGYGFPVLGLHLYTWALVVFAVSILAAGLNLIFASALTSKASHRSWLTVFTLGLLGAIIVANLGAVFAQEGLHWTLPDEPTSYRLWEDLGFPSPRGAPPRSPPRTGA